MDLCICFYTISRSLDRNAPAASINGQTLRIESEYFPEETPFPATKLLFFRNISMAFSPPSGIRRLQLVLLKIALLMGVVVVPGTEFVGLQAPQREGEPWEGQGQGDRQSAASLMHNFGAFFSKKAPISGPTARRTEISKVLPIHA